MKKVLIFMADGTEEIEALTPVDMLRRAGAEVILAGVGNKTVTGSHGIAVVTDISASELGTKADFDMLILPGGMPGTKNLGADKTVSEYIKRAAADGKLIGAICAAPMILGKLGLLKGKKAVCFPGFESYLEGAGIQSERVVRDGDIITAAGAGVAMRFSLALIEALFGIESAKKLEKTVLAD